MVPSDLNSEFVEEVYSYNIDIDQYLHRSKDNPDKFKAGVLQIIIIQILT